MALPIKPTPYLKGKDAEKFEDKILQGLKNPTGYIATPKLNRAKRKLSEYASRHRQK